jgi:[ribosomal protein S5]-alanine N-acetyltransferase
LKLLKPWLDSAQPESIKADRVELRLPVLEDYDAWVRLRTDSRSFLEPWEPSWDQDELQRYAFRIRVRRYQSLCADDQAYAYFIFQKNTPNLLGAITLSNVRRGIAETATAGYWIGATFARQGYMTEALQALCAHAFEALRLHRIEAACLPRNEASVKLLEKCEFMREGYAKDYLRIAGKWEDHLLFAHTRSPL